MDLARASRVIPTVVAVFGALLIAQWLLFTRSTVSLGLRVPLEDRSAQNAAVAVDLKGFFAKGQGAAGEVTAAWPQFRGPSRDNINTEKLAIASGWCSNGPAR